MLTYDDIWETFLDNYKVNDEDIPSEISIIYNDIRNAVMYYNNRMRTKFKCNDALETIEGAETEDERLIIAHYLKLAFLNNDLVLYTSLYQPISPDVGVRNYSHQMLNLQKLVDKQIADIDRFILYTREDFL